VTSSRERLLSTVSGQLGRPHGILSPLVARALNRGSQRAIAGAVEVAQAPREGVVHGIEIAAALQNSGLQVDKRRIDDRPIPRYLFIGRRD